VRTHPAFVVLIAVAGVGLAIQAATNAKMGAALGAPVGSALLNFLIGSVLLTITLASGIFGRARLAGFAEAPWWAYIGGALGAAFVTIAVVAVPRVGAATTFAAVITGQLIGAMFIDTFGWLDVDPVPLNPWRLVGAGLLLAGVILIQQR
jgi:transporter family-2 protein